MPSLFAIRDAVQSVRTRTGDKSIGTHLDRGRLQVIRITYNAKGVSTIAPVTDWLPIAAAIDALNAL